MVEPYEPPAYGYNGINFYDVTNRTTSSRIFNKKEARAYAYGHDITVGYTVISDEDDEEE